MSSYSYCSRVNSNFIRILYLFDSKLCSVHVSPFLAESLHERLLIAYICIFQCLTTDI